MSFKDCMDRAVAGGEMDATRAAQARKAYDLYSEDLPPDQAAARVVMEAGAVAKAQRTRLEANARAQKVIDAKIAAGLPIKRLVEDMERKGSLQGRHSALQAELRSVMNNVLKTFRSNLLGQRRNKATLEELVRGSYGGKMGNNASELLTSFRAAVDKAANMYEAAGGFARYRGKKGLPQSHSQTRVNGVSEDEWLQFVSTRIDGSELKNDLGDIVLPAERDEALRAMYQHITGGGWESRSRSQVGGAYAIGERRLDPDYLPFRNGDDWLAYAEKFGEQPDPWRVMVGYIDSMSHQIAEAEILGVDADAVWEYAKETYLGVHKNTDKAKRQVVFADKMRDVWSGVTQEPQSRLWARSMSSTRQYLSSFQLGSAVISSVSDFATQRMAAGFMGLSKTGHLKMMTRMMASPAFREAPRELGLILENAVDMGSAAYRYSMEDYTVETAGRLSDFTMRSSGLSGLTQMQKDAFGMSAMNDIAKMQKRPWADLPVELKRAFNNFGINEADWNNIQKAEIYEHQGVPFLRPKEIETAAGREAAMGFMELIGNQRTHGVIESSIESKTAIAGVTRPGSLDGELLRTLGQYKSFPIQFVIGEIGRVVNEAMAGRVKSTVSLTASMIIGMTLMGSIAVQLKEMAKGRNPKDMDDLEFWTQAAMQGGGLGIFGDFLFSDVNRFGQGIGQTVGGPLVGLGEDIAKLTIGNARQALLGEDTNLGAEVIDFVASNNPANSIWWARLAVEREIEDQLMSIVDPEAATKFQRKQRKSERESNGYWWNPGQSALAN